MRLDTSEDGSHGRGLAVQGPIDFLLVRGECGGWIDFLAPQQEPKTARSISAHFHWRKSVPHPVTEYGAPTSERGLNVLPVRAGEEVSVVWGVVHDIRLTGSITPAGKGILAYGVCMKLLVEENYYTDPEQWDELSTNVQEAWMVIGAEWFPDLPGKCGH